MNLSRAGVALALLFLAAPVLADGFHSPLLRGKDPRRWAETLRENLGLDRSDSAEESTVAGGGFERRAAAGRLMDVLRYLDRKNVLLREFPDFNYDNIPKFKSETEALLIAIGKDAVPLLVTTLITNITENVTPRGDLSIADDFIQRLTRIIVAIGEDSIDQVIANVDHENLKVQHAMLGILREIVKEPNFGKNVKSWKKWHLIWKAGRDRNPESVGVLIEALDGSDRRFLRPAVDALGDIGQRRAVPALMRILEENQDARLKIAAARALAKIGDPIAVPPIIQLLESSRITLREEGVTALRFLTREMHGYDPRGPAAEREAAVARWRAWWKGQSGK